MEERIIKRQKIRYRKGMIAWESGELTLYKDRVEYSGSSKITIPISDIENVSVNDGIGQGNIIISTNKMDYKFFKNNNATGAAAFFLPLDVAVMGDKKISDLESWRQAIENLRFAEDESPITSSPLLLLKERLAKGEITLSEYKELKKELE